MTLQAKKLLKLLKRAQKTPDGDLYFDFDSMKALGVHKYSEDYVTVDLRKYKDSIYSTLKYLSQLGYIEYRNQNYIRVLHSGWHLRQSEFRAVGSFLFKSVLIPIIVAFLTALITIWLNGFFSQ